ncbi:MAG TPA: TetR-like C-terminal domain-containing protein [Feifaniaceae bacterium]|nr:TetR-like C-terminal domain-containing protein [Feifaniaceae bacterium]
MKQGKTDRRVQYTRMVLRQSLLELLRERPIAKVTVTDLCLRADVNRNTFYSHYESPFSLLMQIEDELYEEIMRSVDRSLSARTISAFLLEVCQSIEANGDLCSILISEHGDKEFLNRIMRVAHDWSIAEWSAQPNAPDRESMELLYSFVANGSVAVIEGWIKSKMQKSPREIAALIEKMTRGGQAAFFPS